MSISYHAPFHTDSNFRYIYLYLLSQHNKFSFKSAKTLILYYNIGLLTDQYILGHLSHLGDQLLSILSYIVRCVSIVNFWTFLTKFSSGTAESISTNFSIYKTMKGNKNFEFHNPHQHGACRLRLKPLKLI